MRLRLVLVGVEGPINLGFIARLADNFDVDELYLVDPRADIEEARRFAAKASYRLDSAVIVNELEDALHDTTLSACTSAHYSRGDDVLRVSMTPWEFAERAISERLVGIVMGRESTGLTRKELDKCDVLVTIPTSERYRSLNLSNATAIILYELFKARISSWKPREPPDSDKIGLLYKYLELLASNAAPHKYSDIVRAFRNILSRADVSREEVSALLYLASRLWRRVSGGCESG